MRADVFTIFPELVDGFCSESLLGKARTSGLLDLRCHDLREHTTDVHRTVDDSPFGGGRGHGAAAGAGLRQRRGGRSRPVPSTCWDREERRFDQALARDAGRGDRGSACCADATRASTTASVSTWSTASCPSATTSWPGVRWQPAWSIEAVDAAAPGRHGQRHSAAERESFGADGGLLEEPQYTRPASFRGWEVPEVLRSGDHARIARWRRAQALHRTLRSRPDLHRRPRRPHRGGAPAVGRVRPRRLSLSVPSGPPFSRRRTSAP